MQYKQELEQNQQLKEEEGKFAVTPPQDAIFMA